MAATVVNLVAFTPVPAPCYRLPPLAASIRVAMASTCMCGTPRTCSASARRARAGVFAGHGDAAGHLARVVHERAVGVARGHPAVHARRNFPGRHARRGAHGRDRHAHGAVLAAGHTAQGMHTVLSLQRMSRRDARQPRPPWSSLTLRCRTSDERAASRARVSESWRQSPQSNLRCRRRGVVRWTGRMYLRVTSTSPPACVKHRRAPRPVEARRLYRGLASQG